MSFREAQSTVDRWVSQFEEGYFSPLTNLARLTEEVGELAREINHRFGEKTKKPGEAANVHEAAVPKPPIGDSSGSRRS